MVGASYFGFGGVYPNSWHATLWTGKNIIDLDTWLIGWTNTFAEAINDRGQIAGYGMDPSGQYDAFLLTSYPINVPEPSKWAMMLLGFAGLGFAAYRRARTA